MRCANGYPPCYKVDLANVGKKIAFELDGRSHNTLKNREADAKKMACLAERGWSVYRVSNEKALALYSTFTSVDTLLISLMGI